MVSRVPPVINFIDLYIYFRIQGCHQILTDQLTKDAARQKKFEKYCSIDMVKLYHVFKQKSSTVFQVILALNKRVFVIIVEQSEFNVIRFTHSSWHSGIQSSIFSALTLKELNSRLDIKKVITNKLFWRKSNTKFPIQILHLELREKILSTVCNATSRCIMARGANI